jgi:hypothetical protein
MSGLNGCGKTRSLCLAGFVRRRAILRLKLELVHMKITLQQVPDARGGRRSRGND